MYLKRLELQGFKSFAEKTVLEFKPGITSVIGPNGSGKSNISDSIRWVLGEQSMKSLRGSNSSDIIFAGTQNRKSLGFAEASIVIDNSDGKLPIEYNEVTVTRKIYRSGETGYFINKTPCRLKDILELFMDTGIGKDGYSIIGQGKIDEILSNKSEDRRRIFEEAAGIVKYRTRKQESEKKLEQTKLNLLRINDILSEIEGTIEPLKMQSEKAKKFLDLREELKGIEVGLFLYNIENYKAKLEEIIKDEDIMQNQYEAENDKFEKIKELKEQLKLQVEEMTEKIEQMQNIGFESTNKIEKINSDINVMTERQENNNTNKNRFSEEIEEVKIRVNELEEEKKQKQDKKINLNQNREKFKNELNEKQKQLDEITKKLSNKELEIEDKKQKVEQNIDKKYDIASEINTQDINFENLEKRQKVVKQETQATISELDEARMEKQELSKGFYDIESKRNEALKKIEEIKDKREEASKKQKEFDDKINHILFDIRMKDSRHKFLVETEKEKEGYIKSVKNLLLECEKDSKLKNGVHGVLANLISTPKEYETAIEMCLGAALQNVITETEDDAKKLIEFLRKESLGRASFLPITSVKGKKVENIKQAGINGIVGIASDLVKYQKKYEQIVLNLLGKTVVVEDMDTAITLSKQNNYSFRIVTLKGDLINPSGAITGGSVATKTVNILGRGREIDDLVKQIKKLELQKEEIEKQKEEYEKSIKSILENSEEFEKNLQEIDIIYATEKQKMVSIEENISKIETRYNKLKEELVNIENEKTENRKIKKQKEEEISILTKEIEELNAIIEEFAKTNKDNQTYIDDLNFDITNLKISVSSFDESKISIDEMIERIGQDIENQNISIQNKETQIKAIEEENKNIDESINNLKQEIENIQKDVSNSSQIIEELKQSRTDNNEKLTKLEEEITNEFKTLEDLKEQLVKLDVKKVKMEQDIEQIINNLWEEYEITPNNAEEFERPTNIAIAQKEVHKLRNQIKELGSINVDSIEEYRKTKERYDFMSEQRLDLENTITKLRKMISDMTETMKEQFAEKFTIINKNFNEVFVELFGGGKAELILEDESNILECGIDIRVQPTGKKLQNMMLLSGGEKAFTAIALLFAILRINPAPFCILDEIEAALDDVNVYRFADYLKKFSPDTQFLVITHRKGTMEAADTVYGVTMEENGISKLLSMKLSQR
ncbi:MAG: chromosome segregation protein SMC [Clostridiaceae bacterium]|nr:chromosome segregation protein SMC [Clostridiaceae bacterium]